MIHFLSFFYYNKPMPKKTTNASLPKKSCDFFFCPEKKISAFFLPPQNSQIRTTCKLGGHDLTLAKKDQNNEFCIFGTTFPGSTTNYTQMPPKKKSCNFTTSIHTQPHNALLASPLSFCDFSLLSPPSPFLSSLPSLPSLPLPSPSLTFLFSVESKDR